MKKIFSVVAMCIIALGGLLFAGCNKQLKNDGIKLQQTGDIELSISTTMVDYQETIDEGYNYVYALPTVLINVKNRSYTEAGFSSQSFKIVSNNEKIKFDGGLFPNTTTYIDSNHTILSVEANTVDLISIKFKLNDYLYSYYGASYYFSETELQRIAEVEKTQFSVYLADELIGTFKVNIKDTP